VLRNLILAASALATTLAIAAPAAARRDSRSDREDRARHLPPPGEIEEMGDRIGQVAEAMMDVDIGPIVDAIDPARRDRDDRRSKETLGDIASRDDPHARERMRDSIDRATFGFEAMIAQFAMLAPVILRSIEDASRHIDDAMDQPPRGRRRR